MSENKKCNHCGKDLTNNKEHHEIFTVGECKENFFVCHKCFIENPKLALAEIKFENKKEKFKNKEMSELTMTELLEDLGYYVKYAQYQSPPFVDQTFNCIWEDIIELFRRFKI